MSVIVVETATVYRAGPHGRRFLSRAAALHDYARSRFREKHRCECEEADYASGYPGFACHVHDLRDRVLPRYLRWLRKRERER